MFPYKSAVGFVIPKKLKALALIKAGAIYPDSCYSPALVSGAPMCVRLVSSLELKTDRESQSSSGSLCPPWRRGAHTPCPGARELASPIVLGSLSPWFLPVNFKTVTARLAFVAGALSRSPFGGPHYLVYLA